MNIRNTALRLAIVAGACATLNACLTSTSTWDRTFGNSVRTITAMQMIDPNASANTDPVAGIDGTAATGALQNYGGSFMAPPPPVNMFTIGVGGGSSGGSSH